MALQNFNVFGMIVFSDLEMTITATALKGKKPIERTFKFPIKFERQNQEAAIPFAALVQKDDNPRLVITRNRAINIETTDAKGEFVKTSDVEEALEKTLDFMENTMTREEDENKEEEKDKNKETLRYPSKVVDLYALSGAIMIYTKDGNVIVDIDRAHDIAKHLPSLIKKASKGVVDQSTKAWLLKTFSKKR